MRFFMPQGTPGERRTTTSWSDSGEWSEKLSQEGRYIPDFLAADRMRHRILVPLDLVVQFLQGVA